MGRGSGWSPGGGGAPSAGLAARGSHGPRPARGARSRSARGRPAAPPRGRHRPGPRAGVAGHPWWPGAWPARGRGGLHSSGAGHRPTPARDRPANRPQSSSANGRIRSSSASPHLFGAAAEAFAALGAVAAGDLGRQRVAVFRIQEKRCGIEPGRGPSRRADPSISAQFTYAYDFNELHKLPMLNGWFWLVDLVDRVGLQWLA